MLTTIMTRSFLVVQVIFTTMTTQAIAEQPQNADSGILPLSNQASTPPLVRKTRSTISWNGHEHDVTTGINVLKGVVGNPANTDHERKSALAELGRLRTQLRGDPLLEQLTELYGNVDETEKRAILIIFLGSVDPRGIPVFVRTLATEKNMHLRLTAASGLAGWNIRQGVSEIVNLLDSTETLPPPNRMRYVRDNALDSFHKNNKRQGWGFPETELLTTIKDRTDVTDDQKTALYIGEIKKWFEENKHRFPDWKQGDPLP